MNAGVVAGGYVAGYVPPPRCRFPARFVGGNFGSREGLPESLTQQHEDAGPSSGRRRNVLRQGMRALFDGRPLTGDLVVTAVPWPPGRDTTARSTSTKMRSRDELAAICAPSAPGTSQLAYKRNRTE